MNTLSSEHAANLKFSVDLKAAALRHLDFLKLVESHTRLYHDPDILRQAVYRYQYFWLPLVVKHKKKNLQAPLDIAWVWHCHMLSPVAYCKDTTRVFGKVIANTSLERMTNSKLLLETAELWQKAYPDHPFFVDITASGQVDQRYLSGITDFLYDFVSAAFRQKDFGYQVSLPHYKDKNMLEKALLRYKKFIYLKSKKPEMFLVPCYDIDLMWHTHQLFPQSYKADMERLLGHLFNHDDTVNDRNEGSKLSISDFATRQTWQEEYNECYSDFGVMYRGPNPLGKLAAMTKEDIVSFSTRSANLVFKKIEVIPSINLEGKLRLMVCTAVNSKQKTKLGTLRGSQMSKQVKYLDPFNFDASEINSISFILEEVKGRACLVSKCYVDWSTCNMAEIVESVPIGQTQTVEKSVISNKMQVDFKVQVEKVKAGPTLLTLYPGPYETYFMPENIESVWGPIPFARPPPGFDRSYEVATHRLLNHRRDVVFTCSLIHSVSLLQSAVQVFYKSSVVAVAHLIGTDSLPTKPEVADKFSCITLNPKAGERAILIKNHQGDWGIVTGRWVNCTPGSPGVSRVQRGTMGSPGTLLVKVRKLSELQTEEFTLPYLTSNYTVPIPGMHVNLKTGIVMISEACRDVAENLALVFSISLLHVLCQPRPAGWRPGQTTKPIISKRGEKKVLTIPSEDMVFVMAAGFLMSTPSNHYVRERFGANACVVCGGGGDVRVDDLTPLYTGSFEAREVIGTFDVDDGGAGCGGCGGCGG